MTLNIDKTNLVHYGDIVAVPFFGLATKYFSLIYPHSKLLCIEPVKSNYNQAKINNLKYELLNVQSITDTSYMINVKL